MSTIFPCFSFHNVTPLYDALLPCVQTMEEWSCMLESQRFRRLQHLLDQSSIYCRFLMEKMEEQQKAEVKKLEKQAKKEDKASGQHASDDSQQV